MADTPTIEEQLAAAQAEAARLREHNAVLLDEKKQLQREHAQLQESHAATTATLQRLQLDGPVDALVEDLATDPKLFKVLWAEGHKFALDEQGRPCVQNKDGAPVIVKDANGKDVPLAFDAKAIAEYLCPRDPKLQTAETKRWAGVLVGSRAGGGNASGGAQGTTHHEGNAPRREQPQPAVQFGLR